MTFRSSLFRGDMMDAVTKQCSKCLTILAHEQFAQATKATDGRQSYCRECQSDYHATWRGNGGQRKQVKATPKMASCHRQVAKAVRIGELEKSESCEKCGSNRKRTQAHHDDYNQPLVIRWLCDRCHREWHHEHGPGANHE